VVWGEAVERRRRIATYAMAGGLLLSTVVAGIGRFRWWESSRPLEALRAQCRAEALASAAESATARAAEGKRTDEIGQVLNQLLSDKDFLALNQHDREIVIDAIRSSSDPHRASAVRAPRVVLPARPAGRGQRSNSRHALVIGR